MNYSPGSLASVLEFCYQSLTLKYIEIGLLWLVEPKQLKTVVHINIEFENFPTAELL